MNMTPSPVQERRETLLKVLNTAEELKDYLKYVRYQKANASRKSQESKADAKIDAIHKELRTLVDKVDKLS